MTNDIIAAAEERIVMTIDIIAAAEERIVMTIDIGGAYFNVNLTKTGIIHRANAVG